MGETCGVLQSVGTTPVSKDLLKMKHNIDEILGASSYKIFGLVAPTTLLFYGLALYNAGKYTLDEIRYLGVSEIILGLLGCIFIGYGLMFWALGFGVLHIVYGFMMWWKYER